MRIFSKKSRARIFTLLLGGVLCASASAGVVTLVEKAGATTSYDKPEVMKIETLVDEYADLRAVNSDGGGHSIMNHYWKVNQANSYETATTSGHYFLGIFDKVGYNANNPVEHDGDVGIWYDIAETENNTASSRKIVGIGYKLQSSKATENGGYGVISFRTRWTTGTGDISLGMMVETGSPHARWQDNGSEGYWIGLSEENVNIVEFGSSIGMSYFEEAVAYTNTPANNDELVITYGVWQSAETVRSIYIKVENKTQGNVAYETTVEDSDLTNNAVYANGTFSIAKTASSYEGMTTDPKLLIAGIDEPLFADGYAEEYSLKNTSYSVYEGEKLPALTDDGYAWVDADETAVTSKTEYDATYAYDYYGNTFAVPVKVAVQVRNAAYETIPEVKKIETLVDSRSDLVAVNGYSYDPTLGKYWALNQEGAVSTSSDRYFLGIYDEVGHNANNPVEHDGDLGVWYDREKTEANTTHTSKLVTAGFKLNSAEAKANGGYGVISFRTRWTTGNGDLSLGMMVNPIIGLARWQENNKTGYWIGLSEEKVNILEYGTAAAYFVEGVAYTNKPANNDELVITYGVWELNTAERAIYLKVENKTQENIAYENLVVDTDITNNTVYANGTFSIAKTAPSYDGMTTDPKLLLAGIDEPLFTPSYALTDTAYSVTEGQTLPTLTEQGYAWADDEELAVYGTEEYDAIYTFDYYGKSISLPTTVEVQVTALPRVTLQLMNGTTELYTDSLLVGESVKLDTLSLENVDTIIGWRLGESAELLRPDTTFTASAEDEGETVVYNVVDMDMQQYDGASIRTTVDANGNGGLRFVAMFNTDDWAANAAYIQSAYGVIVPADDATYYTEANGFTAEAYTLGAQNESFKGKTAYSSEEFGMENADGYSLYTITMTNVKYANYNRTFASMTYITVEYANGDTMTFETNEVKRSVYEVALAAKAHHQANDNAIYNAAHLKVIDGYIANVVDVTYDGDTLSVVDREGHGLARPYAPDGQSKVEGNAVTLVLSGVEADSLLAKEEFAPVWYTANGSTKRYKAEVVYNDGTATVTFTIG